MSYASRNPSPEVKALRAKYRKSHGSDWWKSAATKASYKAELSGSPAPKKRSAASNPKRKKSSRSRTTQRMQKQWQAEKAQLAAALRRPAHPVPWRMARFLARRLDEQPPEPNSRHINEATALVRGWEEKGWNRRSGPRPGTVDQVARYIAYGEDLARRGATPDTAEHTIRAIQRMGKGSLLPLEGIWHKLFDPTSPAREYTRSRKRAMSELGLAIDPRHWEMPRGLASS